MSSSMDKVSFVDRVIGFFWPDFGDNFEILAAVQTVGDKPSCIRLVAPRQNVTLKNFRRFSRKVERMGFRFATVYEEMDIPKDIEVDGTRVVVIDGQIGNLFDPKKRKIFAVVKA